MKALDELCDGDGWQLQHENAPAHSTVYVRKFLACNLIATLDHSPYSPDLASDIFLFLKCKMVTRGQHWDDVETIKCERTRQLKSITSEDFQGCFE